jgi:uncharacterized protein
VRLYLDSSALVKLVKLEPESGPLRRFLRRHRTDGRVTSALARVEVVRSLDAIHLASASSIGADLRAVVTYDRRMADAAASLSLVVEGPA